MQGSAIQLNHQVEATCEMALVIANIIGGVPGTDVVPTAWTQDKLTECVKIDESSVILKKSKYWAELGKHH